MDPQAQRSINVLGYPEPARIGKSRAVGLAASRASESGAGHNESLVTHGRTIWLDQLSSDEQGALDPGIPTPLMRSPDVLVVGGGIQGVATATACQQAGLGSVLVIESSRVGAGATGGAAGLLIPEAHQGSDPAPLVELGRSSLALWQRLEMTFPGGVGLMELDWVALAPHPEGFVVDPSPAVEWLDADQVAALVPGLASATTGALIRRQGRLNPLRAVARLAARLPQVATGVTATAVEVGGDGSNRCLPRPEPSRLGQWCSPPAGLQHSTVSTYACRPIW